MFAIAIDCSDQRPKGNASLDGDLLQAIPELAFKADAGLVSCNDNRALDNRRLHDLYPLMSHVVLYDRMNHRMRLSSHVLVVVFCRLDWGTRRLFPRGI